MTVTRKGRFAYFHLLSRVRIGDVHVSVLDDGGRVLGFVSAPGQGGYEAGLAAAGVSHQDHLQAAHFVFWARMFAVVNRPTV